MLHGTYTLNGMNGATTKI